jgi:hypothetical protein
MLRCDRIIRNKPCGTLRPDHAPLCPACGAVRAHFEPDAQQIAAACANIRAAWRPAEELARTPAFYRPVAVEITEVTDHAPRRKTLGS